MAKITIKELYFGKKYDVQGAVNEELANLQDNSTTVSTSFRELAIIRQTLIALQKLNKNGDCISDKELGDAVTVSLSPRTSELFELNSKDFGATLVCAIRYGMGRHTCRVLSQNSSLRFFPISTPTRSSASTET